MVDEIKLLNHMKNAKTGIKLKEAKYQGKMIMECFSGEEAVDWVVGHHSGSDITSRQCAIEVLQKLVDQVLPFPAPF